MKFLQSRSVDGEMEKKWGGGGGTHPALLHVFGQQYRAVLNLRSAGVSSVFNLGATGQMFRYFIVVPRAGLGSMCRLIEQTLRCHPQTKQAKRAANLAPAPSGNHSHLNPAAG